jgi:hypothetical protein
MVNKTGCIPSKLLNKIFGEVNKGFHSYKIFNISYLDVIQTIIGSYIIYYFCPKYNYFLILGLLFLFGIICHRVFCVRTTIDKLLFP